MTEIQGAPSLKMQCVGAKKRRRRAAGQPAVPEELIDRLEGLLPSGALEEALEALSPRRSPGPAG